MTSPHNTSKSSCVSDAFVSPSGASVFLVVDLHEHEQEPVSVLSPHEVPSLLLGFYCISNIFTETVSILSYFHHKMESYYRFTECKILHPTFTPASSLLRFFSPLFHANGIIGTIQSTKCFFSSDFLSDLEKKKKHPTTTTVISSHPVLSSPTSH